MIKSIPQFLARIKPCDSDFTLYTYQIHTNFFHNLRTLPMPLEKRFSVIDCSTKKMIKVLEFPSNFGL
jgi:hypothetical protein